MRLSLISALAASAIALAACSSTDDTATTSGTGSSSGSGTSYGSLQEQLRAEVGDTIYFDFDRYDIRPDGQTTLQAMSVWLADNPQVTMTVEGHADERGTRDYNLALGERRANSAKQYLQSLGVNNARLATISYGDERPVALGHDEAAWAQNRRDAFVVN